MLRYLIFFAALVAGVTLAADPGVDTKTVPSLASPDEPPAPKEYPHAEALATTAELAKYIEANDPKVILIDARSEDAYAESHIPGAENIQSDQLQDSQNPPYFMPALESLKAVWIKAGIDADSRVIIYDDDDGRLAARIWFALYACGHDHASILNGGTARWKEENRAFTKVIPPQARPGTFEPKPELRGVCAFADLSQFRVRVHSLGKLPTITLLDARSFAEYMGEDVRGKIGGHIPGAANIEWSSLMSGKEHARVWRTPQEIYAILRMGGVEKDQKIAVYDQAGGRSAHLFYTLWLMGFGQACNYAAGWREYGNKSDVEVEK